MTVTDILAIYGALLATGIAAWDVVKFVFERRRLRVACYIANMFEPGIGVTARNLIAYSIANTGGKPMVVSTLGGALRNGRGFLFIPQTVQLPFTLQPGESVVVPGPMPHDIDEVKWFTVHDALGHVWRCSTKRVRNQLASRSKKAV